MKITSLREPTFLVANIIFTIYKLYVCGQECTTRTFYVDRTSEERCFAHQMCGFFVIEAAEQSALNFFEAGK